VISRCARLEYRRADSTKARQVAAALAAVELDVMLTLQELPAYARLILDVLWGIPRSLSATARRRSRGALWSPFWTPGRLAMSR